MLTTPQRRRLFWMILGIMLLVLVLVRIVLSQGPVGSVVGEIGMVFLSAAQVVNEQRQERGFPSADIHHLPARGTYLRSVFLLLMGASVVGVFGGALLFVLEVGHVIGI